MSSAASELERWLEQMRSEGDYDSSGVFSLASQSALRRLGTLRDAFPSLAFLKLVQLANRDSAQDFQLSANWRGMRCRLGGLCNTQSMQASLQAFPDLPPMQSDLFGQALQLLQAEGAQRLEFRLLGPQESWHWTWMAGVKTCHELPDRPSAGVLTVEFQHRLRNSLVWLRHRPRLLKEFIQRSHFTPLDVRIDGRFHPSQLDLVSPMARQFGVTVRLAEGEECFAAVHPAAHLGKMVMVNHQRVNLMHSNPEQLNDSKILVYNLCHLRLDLGQAFAGRHQQVNASDIFLRETRDGLCQTKLCACEEHLLPARPGLPRTLRPLRACEIYLLSVNPQPGTIHIVPIRLGVSLNPIRRPGRRDGSIILAVPPAQCITDASGLQLVQDEACKKWLTYLEERQLKAF